MTNNLDNQNKSVPICSDGGVNALETMSPQRVQKKLYFYIRHLQQMHSELPEQFQLRIPYELLTELANSLLNDQIFDVVMNLLEVQHVTETRLHQLREAVELEHQTEVANWCDKITDQGELEHIVGLLNKKHYKKMKETDLKVVAMLDQKVMEQQSILHDAGVPGFSVTKDRVSVLVQMYLLDLILRLGRIRSQA